MSETPDEQTDDEPENPDAEQPPEPIEPDEPDDKAQTMRQAAAAEGSADIPKKIERAVTDQRKRLSKILGVDLEGSECPTCGGMGFTTGPQEEAPEPVHPDNLVTCEACNGYGEVVTGSRHPNHVTAICTACAGNGYITKAAQPSNVTAITPQTAPPAAIQSGQLLPDGRFLPFGASEPITIPQQG